MSMIQPVSLAAQQIAAVNDVKPIPAARHLGEGQPPPKVPVMDEYVPEEPQEPSGLYWPETDENGQLGIHYDAPAPSGGKPETCTGNTNAVDREIEQLKRKIQELKQQISSETDEFRRENLEREMAQAENELAQKDNDAYRRQHTVFT